MHIRRLYTAYSPTVAGNLGTVRNVLFAAEPVWRFVLGECVERFNDKAPRGVARDPALLTAQHPLRLAGERRAVDRWPCHAETLPEVGGASEARYFDL